MIGKLLQAELEHLIEEGAWEQLRSEFSEIEPPDIADLLVDIPIEQALVLFRLLPRDQSAEVFSYLPFERQEELVESLTNEQVQGIFRRMSPDDRTRLLEEMPAEVTRRLIASLGPRESQQARQLLGYPEDSAGRFMTPRYVAIRPEMTAAQALAHIRANAAGKETLDVVFVVDASGKLLDDLNLSTLALANPDTQVSELEDRPMISIPATTSSEELVRTFERYDRFVIAVTDVAGNMLGIITADDVFDLAEEQATEDIQRLGGMEALDEPYRNVSVWRMVQKRGAWLSILFAGQLLTATVMERFEGALANALVLAVFIPLIISSGGNSGSQATSLIIRALALQELRLGDWFRVLRREFATSLLLGLWLGLLGLIRVEGWQWMGWADYTEYSARVAATIGVSLLGVVLWGSLVGSMLPFVLKRMGLDPATSSAPFVATLVDVTGLLIYLGAATLFLTGALL
ncbi:magnesium transporter [Vulgatibacter sp.]|uniref:magnesium transporter n=1 Tax=Vulgatibacter sp. TaxID=1971226 RepID=UPI003568062A